MTVISTPIVNNFHKKKWKLFPQRTKADPRKYIINIHKLQSSYNNRFFFHSYECLYNYFIIFFVLAENKLPCQLFKILAKHNVLPTYIYKYVKEYTLV